MLFSKITVGMKQMNNKHKFIIEIQS